MSSISRHPLNRLVFSSFAFFGRHRGPLPGTWFVRCYGPFEIHASTVWQTLYRMENAGEIESRRGTRDKLYWPTPLAWASLDAGAAKLAPRRGGHAWDGTWTVALLRPGGDSVLRARARTLLHTEGFVAVQPGVFVHPRRAATRLVDVAEPTPLSAHLTVFRAALEFPGVTELVAHTWSLERLERRYQAFVRRYRRVSAPRSPKSAFLLRMAVTLDYLEVAWSDPELPPELLPDDWPGYRARELAVGLNRALTPAATQFADGILDEVFRTRPALAQAAREYLRAVTS